MSLKNTDGPRIYKETEMKKEFARWEVALIIMVMAGLFYLVDSEVRAAGVETQQRLIELLEDAKEERHLYRDLAVRIYFLDADIPKLEAERQVDEWVKNNRDSVNIKIGFGKMKGNKVIIDLGEKE